MEEPNKTAPSENDESAPENTSKTVRRLRAVRSVSWAITVFVATVLTGYVGWRTYSPQSTPPTAKEVGEVMIKSEFELIDHRGRAVTAADYRGKWQLVFFGFTYCPDVCPTTLSTVAGALDLLGDDANDIVPLFITVDPDRDTPAVMAEYVQAFDPRLVGLTGTAEQIKAAANSYRVYYAKSPQDDAPDGYLMGHSGFIYLMSPDGTFKSAFSHDRDTPETIAEKIRVQKQKS